MSKQREHETGFLLVVVTCRQKMSQNALILVRILISVTLLSFGVEGKEKGSYGSSATATRDEILQRHCTFAKGLHPNLIRFVTKEGYHREIEDVVEVTFTNSPLSPSDFNRKEGGDCRFALLAKFTRDLYIDPYEIANLPELQDDVRVLNNWTDLEGASWDSKSNSTVFIQLHSSATGNLVTTEQLKLPVHFRYQKPLSHSRFKERLQQGQMTNPGALVNPAGYVKVIVPLPRLLLRCDSWNHPMSEDKCHVIKTLCNSKSAKNELCEWISLPYKSNSRQGSQVFVPVGDVDSQLTVTGITLLVVAAGTIFLLNTLIKTKEKLDAQNNVSSSDIIPPQRPRTAKPHKD